MTEIIDVTLTLRPDLAAWPDSAEFRLTPTMRISAGEGYNVSKLEFDLHMGTHVDAPWHCMEHGRTVENLPVDVLIGPACVAHLPDPQIITASDLESLAMPPDTRRLLLRTRNSELWRKGIPEFREDYVALAVDAAQWVVDRGIALIGVDYLSVEPFDHGPLAHRMLLAAEVVILEGLDLSAVEPGLYELLCLPMKIGGADGAPARAVLRPFPPASEAQPRAGGNQ